LGSGIGIFGFLSRDWDGYLYLGFLVYLRRDLGLVLGIFGFYPSTIPKNPKIPIPEPNSKSWDFRVHISGGNKLFFGGKKLFLVVRNYFWGNKLFLWKQNIFWR